jgi:hypothetical protein
MTAWRVTVGRDLLLVRVDRLACSGT